MTRSEIYVEIKNYNLQNDIKDKYGYNYTNLSSATLIEELKKYKNRNIQYELKFPNDRLDKLIEILYKKHIICKSEYEALMA